MTEPIIKVENLGKQYRIGSKEGYKTFRETLVDAVKAPFLRAQEAWSMAHRAWGSHSQPQAPSSVPSEGASLLSAPSSPHAEGISPLSAPSSPLSSHDDFIWALRNVSFEVKRGEVVGIIGRNGAGKSTLLKILSRITEPTEGRVVLKGRVGSLLEVGTGFHSELTGEENIYLSGTILGMSSREISNKFDEIVSFAEMEKFIHTPVKHYSSGMYMRLAFAVAAHLEPEILLVDEVLAVGDVQFQKKCLGKMKEVGKEGRTVLFVSHNMAAVEALCSSGMLLNNGKLIFEGTADDTIRKYEILSRDYTITDVANRKDRQGNQLAKCINLKILDHSNQPTNSVAMGANFSVEITVTGNLSHAIIGILIGNLYKTQMIRGYTYESYNGEINIKGEAIVRCTFEDFPMMHGVYNIHIWLGRQGELADYVENAAELIIEPRDVFGTGRILDQKNGVAFCKHAWKITA